MRKILVLLPIFMGLLVTASAQQPNEIKNAQPGKCYAKCMIGDVYESVNEQVIVKPASTQSVFVPAEYETVTEQALVKEESSHFILTQAEYDLQNKRVMVKEAGKRYLLTPAMFEKAKEGEKSKTDAKRITVVDAVYETITEPVEIKAASKKLTEVPAVYEDATEQYVIEPAYTRVEITEPRFEAQSDRIETKAASTQWIRKKADASCLSADPDDCMVWCLVETPAEYQSVTRRVNKGCDGSGVANTGCTKKVEVPAKMGTRSVRKVKTPASVREEIIPAEYKTITKRVIKTPASMQEDVVTIQEMAAKNQVLKTPASVREETIPAEYTDLKIQALKTPASYREEKIPAEYKAVNNRVVKTPASNKVDNIPVEYTTITKQKLVKAGGFTEWREVICNEKLQIGYTIRQIQQALKDRGYDPGALDNAMGAKTKLALEKFQREKGLPQGSLDLETLKALGIKY